MKEGKYNVNRLVTEYNKANPKMYDNIVDLVETLDKEGLVVLLLEVARQLA